MKNKGFTLTEILAVIVIISLLTLLVTPTIINKLKTNKDKTEETQNKLLFEATSEYTDANKDKYPSVNNSTYCISINTLIENGFLNENIKDVTTKEEFKQEVVIQETIDDKGNKTYSRSTQDICSSNHNNKSITFAVSPDNNTWSKSKKVTIYYPNLQTYGKYYSKDNEDNYQVSNKIKKDVTFTSEGTLYAQMTDTQNNKIIKNSQKVEKIDTTSPEITLSTVKRAKDNLTINLTEDKSGLYGYSVQTKKETPSTWTKLNSAKSKTITLSKETGTYYIYAKDNAGNISYKSIKVVVYDPPTCTITIKGNQNNGWYNGNVTVTMKEEGQEITKKGLAQTKNSTNGKTEVTHSIDGDSIIYYGYVENEAGSATCQSTTFKKDSTKPDITNILNSSNGAWTNKNVVITANITDNLSGVKVTNYSYNQDGSSTKSDWDSDSTNTNVKGTWSAERNDTVYLVAEDNAGNKSIVSAGKVKIDKTAPTCTIAITSGNTCSGADGRTWYTSDVTLKVASASDSASGVDTSSYKMDDYNGEQNKRIMNWDAKDQTITGRVKDKAGNEGKCTKTVSRDTKDPYYGSNESYKTGSEYHYVIELKDDTSGIYGHGLRHSYNNGSSWGSWLNTIDDYLYDDNWIHEVAYNDHASTRVETWISDVACHSPANKTWYFSW